MLGPFKNWFRKNTTVRCCCFHFGRCGSTLLGNLLAGHPRVDWQSELFHGLHEKTDDLVAFQDPMELLTRPIANCSQPVFGFETKFQHLDPNGLACDLSEFTHRLAELGFNRLVLLTRKNYLRQAISVARGQLTGQWHFPADQPRPKFEPFRLNLNSISLGGFNRELVECFSFLDETYSQARQCFERVGIPLLELVYESDLESNAQIAMKKMSEFLGIENRELQVSVKKLGGQPIDQMVSNADEISTRLQGTPYHWMVD